MQLLIQLIISTIAVIITAFILPGVHIDSALTAFLVAAVLALLNAVVKPILVILTIPITVVTLGLFLLVINAALILLAGRIVDGFEISGFWTAVFFSIILSLINSVFNSMNSNRENE